jgi:DNA-binding winged helix-turn-helix (wHTH) protein/Tfp pilus assembly protein PilF
MPVEKEFPGLYEFGPFRVDPARRLLLRGDDPVAVTPKAFDTLVALLENSGRVVGKEELLATVWPDTFVEEVNLAVHVSALRKALGDSAAGGRYIATIPKRGYCFVAEVRRVAPAATSDAADDPAPEPEYAPRGEPRRRPIPLRVAALGMLVALTATAGLFFLVERSISREVGEALAEKRDGDATSLRGTDSLRAHRAYVKGRYYLGTRSPGGLAKAIEHFNKAIEADPAYALAYAGLADCYNVQSIYGGGPPAWETYPKAKAAAMRAIELDATLAEPHASLAYARMRYDWDWPEARRGFEQALSRAPCYATAHHWYGEYLMFTGDAEGAVREIKHATKLDPLSAVIRSDLAWAHYFGRDYDRAIRQARKTLELRPNFGLAVQCMALAYEQKGMYAEAEEALERLGVLEWPDGAHLFAASGRKERARQIAGDLKARTSKTGSAAFGLALISAGLGEHDEALGWLEVAYDGRAPGMVYLKVDPRFDGLRSDPRFENLLRRVGL